MHHMIMTLEASRRLLFEWIEWYIIDHAYQSVVYIWKYKAKRKPFSEPTLWASSHHKHLINICPSALQQQEQLMSLNPQIVRESMIFYIIYSNMDDVHE